VTRRVLALRAERVVPESVTSWPVPDQVSLLFRLGTVYADLECGHAKRLHAGHWGDTEWCWECDNAGVAKGG